MASRGDILAQEDSYLEPEGADFANRTWVNESTSRTTQTEKSKRGGDEENLSKPVVTINCETSATSGDNWEFFGDVESKYSQMDSMTYELSGGASGSGLVTLGDFTSRVDGPFGGNWRLPVSPLAVGVTNLWVRGKNLKEKWGDRAFKSFTRTPTGAPSLGIVFDEFTDPSLGRWWTERNGVRPYYQGGAPSDAPGGTNIQAHNKLTVSLPARVGTGQHGGVIQDYAGNFDAYVKMVILEGGGGGTDGTTGFFEIYDLQSLWTLVLEYSFNQGDGEYYLSNFTRNDAGDEIFQSSFGTIGVTQDTVWLRIRYRSGDPQPILYSSTNDGASWENRVGSSSKSDLSLGDLSLLRLGFNGENNDSGDPANVNMEFLRDGSGL